MAEGKRAGEMSPRRYGAFMAAALALIFLASNTLAHVLMRGARLDLTENHLYSLSDGTKTILASLAEPIDITLYYSADASARYPLMRAYSARVRELLRTYAARAHGQIRLREINPERFTESEDAAVAAGIEAQTMEPNAPPIYFGIGGANAVDERVSIPFLDPDREAYLEYEITRLISELESPRHVKVALVTSLPLDPRAAGDPNSDQPLFMRELARAMDVQVMPRGFTAIPDDVEELVVIQPWALSVGERYAIDQFMMRKGRAFMALDPAAVAWVQASALTPPSVEPSATLDALLGPWGLAVSHDVVLDGQRALQVETQDDSGRTIVAPQPMFIAVPPDQIDKDDLITSALTRGFYFGAPGAITWRPIDGEIVAPLAHSSKATMRFPAAEALAGARAQDVLARFAPSGRTETFVVRVSGALKSAFGPVAPVGVARAAPHLAQSARPVEMVLVSDVDFLRDSFYVSQQGHVPVVDNGALALNAIDLLAGSDALVSLRSRAPALRALGKIEDMRKAAQARLLESETKLRATLTETEDRLAAIEAKGRGSGFFSGDLGAELTPEERDEVEKFRAQAVRVRGQLRDVERDYRQEVDQLEAWVTALDVWLAPGLIALAGLLVYWRRARRRSA
jgi:ABC-type uncharacterized transport system involved in gliding motility auxiliary subunit